MLSFDWSAPPSLAAVRGRRTVVVLRFEAVGSRTKPTLDHTARCASDGVDGTARDGAYHHFDEASGVVLGNLQSRYAPGGAPRDRAGWPKQVRDPAPTCDR